MASNRPVDRMQFAWRAMRFGDLGLVEIVAESVHVDFPERAEIPLERLALFPAGCMVFANTIGLIGYCIAHPWTFGVPPALDTLLHALPEHADTLYIHDLALLPAARGAGAGRSAIATLLEVAEHHGLPTLSLIAVSASGPFWSQNGFADAAPTKSIASYGAAARYMARATAHSATPSSSPSANAANATSRSGK